MAEKRQTLQQTRRQNRIDEAQKPLDKNIIVDKYKNLARKANISRGTKESIDWFRNRVRKDSRNRSFERVSQGLRESMRPRLGSMVMYQYDPKWKKRLPYYDTQPLIILLEKTTDGWYGINMHYLPPSIRAEILVEVGWTRRVALDKIARKLQQNEYLKHACKRYLSAQVTSRMSVVPRTEWEIVVQLPFEAFEKLTVQQVWRKARNI